MNLKEQEEAYPPTQISEALYEGGHLEYYQDNATGAQEETIRLNQDDSPHHTTNIQSVGTSQLSQVEFFDSPPVWRVVGVLLTLVSDDEDKSYGLKIIREFIKPGWASVLSYTNDVLGYISGIGDIQDDNGEAFGFEKYGREVIVPFYSPPGLSSAVTPSALEDRTGYGLKKLGTLNVDLCPAPLFITDPTGTRIPGCIEQAPENTFLWNLLDYSLLTDVCHWDIFCPPYTFSGLPNPAKRRHRFSDSPESSDARKFPRVESPDALFEGLPPSEDLPGHWEWPEAGEVHEGLYPGGGDFYDEYIYQGEAVHSGDIDEWANDVDIFGGGGDIIGGASSYANNSIVGVVGGGAGGNTGDYLTSSSLAGALSGAGAASSGAGVAPFSAGVSPSGPGVAPSGAGVSPSGAGVSPSGAGVAHFGTGAAPSGSGVAPSGPGAAPSGPGAAASDTSFSLADLGVNPVLLFPPFTDFDTSQFDDSQLELFMELAFRCEFTDLNPDLGASHSGRMSTEDKVKSLFSSSVARLGMDSSKITDARRDAIIATVVLALPVHFNLCKTNARYILHGAEADGGYGFINGGDNTALARALLEHEAYLYAGGVNRLPGAVKYSHPALRQLAHMIVFGKIYRSKNPLPGHITQTIPEFYGNPALRTTRPDTGLIFGASIFFEDLLLAAGYEKTLITKKRNERYTYLHADFHLPENYNRLEPTKKQWLTAYRPGEPRVFR